MNDIIINFFGMVFSDTKPKITLKTIRETHLSKHKTIPGTVAILVVQNMDDLIENTHEDGVKTFAPPLRGITKNDVWQYLPYINTSYETEYKSIKECIPIGATKGNDQEGVVVVIPGENIGLFLQSLELHYADAYNLYRLILINGSPSQSTNHIVSTEIAQYLPSESEDLKRDLKRHCTKMNEQHKAYRENVVKHQLLQHLHNNGTIEAFIQNHLNALEKGLQEFQCINYRPIVGRHKDDRRFLATFPDVTRKNAGYTPIFYIEPTMRIIPYLDHKNHKQERHPACLSVTPDRENDDLLTLNYYAVNTLEHQHALDDLVDRKRYDAAFKMIFRLINQNT